MLEHFFSGLTVLIFVKINQGIEFSLKIELHVLKIYTLIALIFSMNYNPSHYK